MLNSLSGPGVLRTELQHCRFKLHSRFLIDGSTFSLLSYLWPSRRPLKWTPRRQSRPGCIRTIREDPWRSSSSLYRKGWVWVGCSLDMNCRSKTPKGSSNNLLNSSFLILYLFISFFFYVPPSCFLFLSLSPSFQSLCLFFFLPFFFTFLPPSLPVSLRPSLPPSTPELILIDLKDNHHKLRMLFDRQPSFLWKRYLGDDFCLNNHLHFSEGFRGKGIWVSHLDRIS